MSTLSSYAPAYPTPLPERDGADFEPDDEWKRKLKQDIEQRFKSMVQEARDNQQVQLMEGNVNREELDHEYKRTLHNIKGLAEEQYQLALMTERNERRWIAGVQMLPGWNDVLHEEQENIMNGIKQSNHSDNSARAAESRIDEQGTNGSLTSTAASAPRRGSESQSSDPPPTREAPVYDRARSRTFSSPSSTTASQKDPPLPPATRYQIGGRESTPSIKKENTGRSKEELTRREAESNPLQPQFRKRTEEIKHTRAKERKHQDPGPVIGSESWDRSQMKKMEEQLEEDELSSTSEEESEHDRHDGDSEEDDDDEVHVKARELEAELQRLQRTRREADVKIQALALEFRRLKEEERRMENEARKADEEVRQKEELRPKELWQELELWREEETELQWEEELELQREEELRLQREEEPRLQWEEELELQQEEERELQREEELEQDEELWLQREEELQQELELRQEEEIRKEELRQKEELRWKELELRWEEELRRTEELELCWEEEERQKEKEELRQKELQREEELRRKEELELRRKEELELRRKEEELRQKEEELRQKEEDLRQKEEELRQKEELRREEAELVEARCVAERLADEARKEEETRRKEKELKKREDDARKKAEDARKLMSEAAKKAEEMKRKEVELKKREEQLIEDELRNQELKRQAEQIAHEAKRAMETIQKVEDSGTPRTFGRSGYSGFSNSERMLPQAGSHGDQQEQTRRQQEKVEAEIQLVKVPSREDVIPTEQNWRVEGNHQPPPRSNNGDASQEKLGVSRHHPQVSPTKASCAPPASMPMPRILQVPIISESSLSRKPKERVIHPPSGEYVATKLVDNAPGRTNVIPREVLEPIETGFPAPWIRNSIDPSVPCRPLDLLSATFESAHEDDPEPSTTSNANQAVQLPSQNSQRSTAPWLLASRKLVAPKKPSDDRFKLHMAELRRQADGVSVSSTSSTPRTSFILGSHRSIRSSVFSESFSIASLSTEVLSAEVECPPTPVFTDEIPRGLTPIAESSFFTTQAPKRSVPKNSYPVQNSPFPSNSASLLNFNLAQRTPTPTGSVRRGYWNRRGDHLTRDGCIVFPPPEMQYPKELRMYPFEIQGYQDHSGFFIAYVRRPEHPQSLSKHGNPPERPYESFVTYV